MNKNEHINYSEKKAYDIKDLTKILGLSPYIIKRMIKNGLFPKPNPLKKNPKIWNKELIKNWLIDNQIYLVDI